MTGHQTEKGQLDRTHTHQVSGHIMSAHILLSKASCIAKPKPGGGGGGQRSSSVLQEDLVRKWIHNVPLAE